ncbi:MAG: hypothetical protein ACXAE3_00900 [Candidatus Kariarchaeaceae archaeon]|jgi:hypothetical protein
MTSSRPRGGVSGVRRTHSRHYGAPRIHNRRMLRYNRRYRYDPYYDRRDYYYYNNRNRYYHETDFLSNIVGILVILFIVMIILFAF